MLMRWQGLFVVLCALVCVTAGTVAVAQESQEPDAAPADQAAASEEPGEEEKKRKLPFALYVYASGGMFEADPINSSISTSAANTSFNTLDLEDVLGGRAELGWKLPNKKGDFRLTFNGFTEDDYRYVGIGRGAQVTGIGNVNVLDDLDWWTLTAENGQLHSVRNPPLWEDSLDDANMNNSVDREEVRYGTPNLDFMRNITDDLQNRAQHIELTYGRAFGGRRYSGRWWGGLRSFTYEGNILAGAWLNTSFSGEGYTDGTNLRMLNLAQETTGLGPTGALEADFNFFEGRVVLYLKGQAAFMVADLEVDSGPFFTLVNTTAGSQDLVIPVAAQLQESRSKSTWQTSAEAGARINMKNGIMVDFAYTINGYLDSLLLVSSIQIPETLGQAGQGTSAIFNTHDLVYEGVRVGVGFQF